MNGHERLFNKYVGKEMTEKMGTLRGLLHDMKNGLEEQQKKIMCIGDMFLKKKIEDKEKIVTV